MSSGQSKGAPHGKAVRLLLEVVSVAVVAIIGQIVLPASTPYLQMWMFDATGWVVGKERFFATATYEEVAKRSEETPSKVEVNRVFCGISIYETKYCLMHPLKADLKVNVRRWTTDEDRTTKAVFLGERGNEYSISWISGKSGTGGWAHLNVDVSPGDFAGYGIACVSSGKPSGAPTPIKALFGNLSEFSSKLPSKDRDGFYRELLGAMSKSPSVIALLEPGACGERKKL